MADPYVDFLNSAPQNVSDDAYKTFLNAPQAARPIGTGEDVARSAASGLLHGIPYAIDMPAAALATGIEKATGSPGGFKDLFQQNMQNGINPQISKVTGPEYQPLTEAGQMAKGAGMAVAPALVSGGTSLLESAPEALGATAANAVKNVGRAAVGGATGTVGSQVGGGVGKAIGGDTGETVGEVLGGAIGGTAGVKAPEIAGSTMRGLGQIAAPTTTADLAALAKRAQDFDIPLSVNQIAPSATRNTFQKVSQAAPFSGVSDFQNTQRQAFNKALAGTLGEDSPNLGPDTINNFLQKSSTGFDNILGGKTIKVSDDNLAALDSITQNAKRSLDPNLASVVEKNIDDLKDSIFNGTISGDKLASIRSSLIKNIPRAQAGAKEYLGDIPDVIDNMASTSMTPEEAKQLQTLRYQWRNFRTMEPLLEKSVNGNINPTDLLQRVASSPYIKAARSSLGNDDLVDLARIGKIMPVLGGSDTYEKATLGGSAGALATTAIANPVTGAMVAAKAAPVLALNRGYQSYVNQSPALVNRVINKSLPPAPLGNATLSKPYRIDIGTAPNPSEIIKRRP